MTDTLLHPDMREATRLTRAGRLTEATALLQRLLRGETSVPNEASEIAEDTIVGAMAATPSRVIDVAPDSVDMADPRPASRGQRTFGRHRLADAVDDPTPPRRTMALRGFLERTKRRLPGLGTGGPTTQSPTPAPGIVPEGRGQFTTGSFTNPPGRRG